jgi:hypothetical protein
MLVTQEELDDLLRANAAGGPPPKAKPEGSSAHRPAAVPLTWSDAGLAAPRDARGPEVSREELETVTNGSLPEEGSKASRERIRQTPVQAALASLLPLLRELPHGIELPAAVFSVIVDRLSLLKAALLLHDPTRGLYAPWASIGYDETTLHRLRISIGVNAGFPSIADGKPALVSDRDGLLPYQSYFSSREYSQIAALLLVPFLHEGKLIGAALVTEFRGPVADAKDLMEILSAVAAETAPMIHAAREEKLHALSSVASPEGARGEKELEAYLESSRRKNEKILFFSLSLAGFRKAVMKNAPHIDVFRLREDMRAILNGFLADLGKAVALSTGNDQWILAVADGRKTDAPLLVHQLAAHLERVFTGVDASRTMDPSAVRVFAWPEEGGDAREILSRFTA